MMVELVTVDGVSEAAFLKKLQDRAGAVNEEVTRTVEGILRDVRENGDEAVRRYTLQFDGKLPPAP